MKRLRLLGLIARILVARAWMALLRFSYRLTFPLTRARWQCSLRNRHANGSPAWEEVAPFEVAGFRTRRLFVCRHCGAVALLDNEPRRVAQLVREAVRRAGGLVVLLVVLALGCGGYPPRRAVEGWTVRGDAPAGVALQLAAAHQLAPCTIPPEVWGGVVSFDPDLGPGVAGLFAWYPDDVPLLMVLWRPGEPVEATALVHEAGHLVWTLCGLDGADGPAFLDWVELVAKSPSARTDEKRVTFGPRCVTRGCLASCFRTRTEEIRGGALPYMGPSAWSGWEPLPWASEMMPGPRDNRGALASPGRA